MSIRFVPATPELIERFVMRPADEAEVSIACPYDSSRGVLEDSVNMSVEAAAAVDGDEVVAFFGLSESTSYLAHPWMLSAASISRYGRRALFVGFDIVTWWKRRTTGKLLCNYVHRENTSAVRYIQRLGAVVVPSPTGPFDFFYFPNHV